MESAMRMKHLAEIYWDVNQLKKVNDTYGHIEGDILIAKVAESIKMVMDANASASAGYACGRGNEIKKIIGMADKKMYANKEVHREK